MVQSEFCRQGQAISPAPTDPKSPGIKQELTSQERVSPWATTPAGFATHPRRGWPALPQLEPLPPLQLLGYPNSSSTVEKPQEVGGCNRGKPSCHPRVGQVQA